MNAGFLNHDFKSNLPLSMVTGAVIVPLEPPPTERTPCIEMISENVSSPRTKFKPQ